MADRQFNLRDFVRKKSGSWWEGRVVGFYSTDQSPDGVAVQLDKPMGPVQIYPASALEIVPAPENHMHGIERAARFVEKRLKDYVQEHGSPDPETGTVEFPGNGDEYVGELEEIIDGIRALANAREADQ